MALGEAAFVLNLLSSFIETNLFIVFKCRGYAWLAMNASIVLSMFIAFKCTVMLTTTTTGILWLCHKRTVFLLVLFLFFCKQQNPIERTSNQR